MFSGPGGSVALAEAVRSHDLSVIDAAGSTAACLMAAVTGELDDAPGAAIVSVVDGVTAVVAGAAHATRDRAPVIIVSDGAAEARLLDPVTKASLVADATSAAHWIAHAAQLAMAVPRGAVHLAVRDAVVRSPALPLATSCRRPPMPVPLPSVLDALGDAIATASRPIIVTGLEIDANDAKWVRALAESLPAPVLATPKGKGAMPDPHPLALGLLTAGHPLGSRADLIVALGVDPVEVSPGAWPSGIPTVHVSGAAATGGLDQLVLEVVGDIGLVIEELAPHLRGRTRADWDVAQLDRLKRALSTLPPAAPYLTRRRVVALVREATPAGTIATLDAPFADVWQSVAPRELLIPNGVATAGFALPAAIAAAIARENVRVVAIGGAPGVAAMAGELSTIARVGLPIVVVAFDQEGTATAVTEAARDARVATALAESEEAFAAAFARAWTTARPALIIAGVRG